MSDYEIDPELLEEIAEKHALKRLEGRLEHVAPNRGYVRPIYMNDEAMTKEYRKFKQHLSRIGPRRRQVLFARMCGRNHTEMQHLVPIEARMLRSFARLGFWYVFQGLKED